MSKLSLSNLLSHLSIIICLILGLLGFSQKISMYIVIPISIILFFLCMISEIMKKYFNKNRRIDSSAFGFLKLIVVAIALIIVVVVVLRTYVIK